MMYLLASQYTWIGAIERKGMTKTVPEEIMAENFLTGEKDSKP